LKEEIVNVEVWTYNEPRLYTVQEQQVKNDRKKSFQTVYHLKEAKLIQIATKEFPNSLLSNEGNGDFALITTTEPYQLSSQWTGQFSKNDLILQLILVGFANLFGKSTLHDHYLNYLFH